MTAADDYERQLAEYCWDDDAFWQVLERAFGDTEQLVKQLASLERSELIGFQWTFEAKVARMYGVLEKVISDLDSEDAMDNFAAGLVTCGRAAYDALLADPKTVPSEVPSDANEGLRWVAGKLFYKRYAAELPPVGYDDEWTQ